MLICGLVENEKFAVSNSTADILNCGHRGKLFNLTHQTFHMMTRPKKILLDILQIFSSIQVRKCFDAVGLFRMGISFKLEKTHLRLRARNLRKGEKLFLRRDFNSLLSELIKHPLASFFVKSEILPSGLGALTHENFFVILRVSSLVPIEELFESQGISNVTAFFKY